VPLFVLFDRRLVSRIISTIVGDPEFVILRQFRDLQDADLAKSALESAGFECYLRDDITIGMNWGWSDALGGVKLLVRKEDVDGARQLLDQIPAGFNVEGVGEYKQPRCPQCQSLTIFFEGLGDRQRHCQSCGHAWEESDDGSSQKTP
jgi:hypothetical protein